MSIAPSKKVLSFFVLSTALVFSIITIFGGNKSSSNANLANTLAPGEKISLPENPNWEDDFNALSFDHTPNDQGQTQETPENQTTTDTVATSLLSNYLVLKQNGLLNQSSAQKLVDQSLNTIKNSSKNADLNFSFNVIPDNGKQTMESYGDTLGDVLRSHKPDKIKNEMEIIIAAATQKNAEKLSELDEIISVYENLSIGLEVMPVPQTFVKAHTQMTRGIFRIAHSLKEVREVLNDPVRGLEAMQTYQESAVMFNQAKVATDNFILRNGIVYEQGSGGYYLLYGI